MNIRFMINGRDATVETPPERRVVDLLREELDLTGTKEGCGSGECGACAVLIDGEPRLSCLMLAAQLEGKAVITIEGLANGNDLHPVQDAFVRCGAVQCGFCSPGMILAASALLTQTPDPTRDQIREGLAGNLCRCTGYQKIVDAVEEAARSTGWPADPGALPAPSDLPQGLWGGDGGCHRGRGEQGAKGDSRDARIGIPCRTAETRKTQVFLPRHLDDLWSCMAEHPEAQVFAGGTDLFVQMRARKEEAPVLIGLERIVELQGFRETPSGFWIGAGNTHRRLLDDPRIRSHFPVLAQALQTLGSPLIRNMGTIGGNLCTASPAGDALPPLYVLGAELEVSTHTHSRILPIGAFVTGPGKTAMHPGEILTGIRLNRPDGCEIHHYEKVGQRKALACAIASMAALLKISPTGVIEAARFAWGSVGPTVITSAEVEAALIGERLSPAVLEKAAAVVREAVSPIGDLRASANYRRRVSGNLLLRLGTDLFKRPVK